MDDRQRVYRLALAAASLLQREIVRFYRQKSRIVGALGTPVVFWVLIGSGMGSSFHSQAVPQGMGYLEYFFPGTLVLILLFTAIFSTISIIEDRNEGFLQSVLVAPTSRSAIVLGKVLGGTTLAVQQGVLFLLLAPLIGLPLHLWQALELVAVMFLVGFGLTGLGFAIAWSLESTQGFHAIMNLFLIPLWLLSGALFPASGAPAWLRWVMNLNPLTYGLVLVRGALFPRVATGTLLSPPVALLVTVLFCAMIFTFALRLVNRPIR